MTRRESTHRDRARAACRALAVLTAALMLNGCASRDGGARAQPPTVFLSSGAPAEQAGPDGPARDAVFGTYNLHWLRDPAGLRADLARLDFVTAWAFQEVRSTAADEAAGAPASLRRLLPPGDWHVAWVPLNALRELGSADVEGQAIASRHPIRSAAAWELEPPPSSGGGKRRVALAAVLDVDGTDVLFVNTDHAPGVFSPARRNLRQARRLLDRLRREPDATPVIVAGDFNTAGCVPRLVSARADREGLRRLMCQAGFRAAPDSARPTFRAGPYAAALDHVFVRGVGSMEAEVAAAACGSDHLPLWCRVRLPAAVGRGAAAASPQPTTAATTRATGS